jgi:hypothetical protein
MHPKNQIFFVGIASVARLQREEVSRSAKEHGGTGTFSTGFYEELASSLNFF